MRKLAFPLLTLVLGLFFIACEQPAATTEPSTEAPAAPEIKGLVEDVLTKKNKPP
jgi:hypothetical protein